MYLAQFESESGLLVAGACRWAGAMAQQVGTRLGPLMFREPAVDVAVRLQHAHGERSLSIIVSAPAAEADAVRRVLENMVTTVPASFTMGTAALTQTLAGSASEFDHVTRDFPEGHHLRLDLRKHHHGGVPLACGFQLLPFFRWMDAHQEGAWQGHFRHQRCTPEVERRTRHYLARLKLDKPFSERVRQLQELQAARCLTPGWTAEEFLAMTSANALAQMRQRLQDHFTETFGRMGFAGLPVEIEDAEEWLSSGLHSTRLEETPAAPNVLGASWYDPAELAGMLATAWHTPSTPDTTGSAPVFISYASADYATAERVCQILEQQGRRCWLAPRDINNTLLSYPVAIEKAIGEALAVVVVVSSAANLSVHIPREVDMALERRLPIIPLRIQEILPAGQLNYLLRTCQWVEAHRRDIKDAISEIHVRLGTTR